MVTGGISANAADGGKIYPKSDEDFIQTLSFSALSDYAIEEDLYVFADGKYIKVYNDGYYTEYKFNSGLSDTEVKQITDVDVKNGVIYCGAGDAAYLIKVDDKEYTFEQCKYTFEQKATRILDDDYLYNILDGNLNIYNLMSFEAPTTYEGEFSDLKQYGEKIYAINGNSLYEFEGTEATKLDNLEYIVNADSVNIAIGQAKYKLKNFSSIQFAEIEKDAFLVEVDLSKLDNDYYVTENIIITEENTVALLLYESDDVSIVSIKDKAYAVMTSSGKIHKSDVEYASTRPFDSAQITVGGIYASPFIASGTVLATDMAGAIVKVICRIEHETLERPFYEVECTSGNTSIKGYVADGFLDKEKREDNKQPNYDVDPEYSEDTDTKTILIIFAVIVLVIAALAYITHVSAKGKKKDKKKKDKESEE